MALTSITRLDYADVDKSVKEELIIEAEVTGTLTVDTGLESVDTVEVTLQEDVAVTTLWVSAAISNQTTNPGQIILKGWKPTATDNCTPVASTTAVTVVARVRGDGPKDN